MERGIASQPLNPLINSITDGEVVSISQVQQEQADVILIGRGQQWLISRQVREQVFEHLHNSKLTYHVSGQQ